MEFLVVTVVVVSISNVGWRAGKNLIWNWINYTNNVFLQLVASSEELCKLKQGNFPICLCFPMGKEHFLPSASHKITTDYAKILSQAWRFLYNLPTPLAKPCHSRIRAKECWIVVLSKMNAVPFFVYAAPKPSAVDATRWKLILSLLLRIPMSSGSSEVWKKMRTKFAITKKSVTYTFSASCFTWYLTRSPLSFF